MIVPSTASSVFRQVRGLDVLTWPVFDAFGLDAVATTRAGGVSAGGYGALNLSLNVGDDPAHVLENRRRAAAALDADPADFVFAAQVHGSVAQVVGAADRGRGTTAAADAIPGADVLVTADPGTVLAVLAADCVPIVLYDPAAHVLACAHAGWRGTVARAAASAVAAMESLGAHPADIVAGVGPAAFPYQVGAEVADAATAAFGAEAAGLLGPGQSRPVEFRPVGRQPDCSAPRWCSRREHPRHRRAHRPPTLCGTLCGHQTPRESLAPHWPFQHQRPLIFQPSRRTAVRPVRGHRPAAPEGILMSIQAVPTASGPQAPRGQEFRYESYQTDPATGELTCHYSVDGRRFTEQITFRPGADWDRPATAAAARLVFLLAGVSYYKTAAPPIIHTGDLALTRRERSFLRQFYLEGLGEFAYRNQLDLSGLRIDGPEAPAPSGPAAPARDNTPSAPPAPRRALVPFGGGIDSIVTVELVRPSADIALFVVSRPGARFDAIERPAAVTGLPVVRAGREIDPQLLRSGELGFLNGHVPVTGIISAIAVLAATLEDRDAVVMSNEWSASVPTRPDRRPGRQPPVLQERGVRGRVPRCAGPDPGHAGVLLRAAGPDRAVDRGPVRRPDPVPLDLPQL